MNELITPESIATLTGATGATVIVSSGIQKAFDYDPKWLALLVAMILSIGIAVMNADAGSDYFLSVINGFLIYLSPIGANAVTGTDAGKGVQARGNPLEAANASRKRLFRTKWF